MVAGGSDILRTPHPAERKRRTLYEHRTRRRYARPRYHPTIAKPARMRPPIAAFFEWRLELRGRADDDEITVFESLGLAAEDLAAASYLYEKATGLGAGTSADF